MFRQMQSTGQSSVSRTDLILFAVSYIANMFTRFLQPQTELLVAKRFPPGALEKNHKLTLSILAITEEAAADSQTWLLISFLGLLQLVKYVGPSTSIPSFSAK